MKMYYLHQNEALRSLFVLSKIFFVFGIVVCKTILILCDSLYVFVLDHFNRSPCDQHSTHTHTRSDYKVPLRLLRRDDDEDVEF